MQQVAREMKRVRCDWCGFNELPRGWCSSPCFGKLIESKYIPEAEVCFEITSHQFYRSWEMVLNVNLPIAMLIGEIGAI